MSLTIYSPPYGEPVSLPEIKSHCKADADITAEDALLSGLVTSGRHATESASLPNTMRNAVMLATEFELKLDSFPYHSQNFDTESFRFAQFIQLPRAPLVSVESFTYVDTGGVTQTVSASLYSVDLARGRINLAYNCIWPIARWIPDAVTIRFIAGIAAVFTVVAATDVCTVQGRVFANDDRVQVMNSGGALPAGLLAGTTYYVVNASGATFKLSLTSGGSAIDITSTGSGVHFIGKDLSGFQTLRNAMMLLIGYWYRNREAVQIAPGLTSVQLPMAVDALVASVYV